MPGYIKRAHHSDPRPQHRSVSEAHQSSTQFPQTLPWTLLASDVLKQKKAGNEGYGLSSVRFVTFRIHKNWKKSRFLGVEDSILYSSCFDANGGLFEAIMKEDDAIITEELNHASIIDGVRLSKAKRYVFKHSDMNDLEAKCKEARGAGARHMIIATDGVFSMDGDIANLKGICDVADKYDSLVMVDDSHATAIGKTGRTRYNGLWEELMSFRNPRQSAWWRIRWSNLWKKGNY